MKIIKYLLFLVILWITGKPADCQSNFGMWNTFSLEKDFTKKFSARVEEELRLKDNISHLNLLYTSLGLSYKPLKGLKLSILYRLTEKYTEEHTFNYKNRLMFDASYKYHLADFVMAYRSRIQTEVTNKENSNKPEWFWRNKFEVKYNFKKISPYLGTELRYQIKVPKHPETDGGWHRVRLFAGIDYNLNKNNVIGLYYLKQHEFYILDPNELDIIGLQYSVTLPHKKKQSVDKEKTI